MTDREYNSCVSDHADGVYRFILKNLQHAEDARDVVQSAFEKMWVNRDKVNAATAKSYLFTVAYNQMIDHIRKNKRIELREHFNEDARIASGDTPSFKRELEKALQQLTPLQKSLVL
jgi:RNA polymerase sigma-70 factor (ECF subfamily)